MTVALIAALTWLHLDPPPAGGASLIEAERSSTMSKSGDPTRSSLKVISPQRRASGTGPMGPGGPSSPRFPPPPPPVPPLPAPPGLDESSEGPQPKAAAHRRATAKLPFLFSKHILCLQ